MFCNTCFLDVVEASPPEEKELVYSEAEDGKPKPIPVAEFTKYFKNKSSNGAIVLKEEFKARIIYCSVIGTLCMCCMPMALYLSYQTTYGILKCPYSRKLA